MHKLFTALSPKRKKQTHFRALDRALPFESSVSLPNSPIKYQNVNKQVCNDNARSSGYNSESDNKNQLKYLSCDSSSSNSEEIVIRMRRDTENSNNS